MNRIRELRKQMKITQKELAKHLKITDSTLSYWEMGKYEPDIDALKSLSSFFQVPIDYLLGGELSDWVDLYKLKVNFTEADITSESVVAENETMYRYTAFNRKEFDNLTKEEIDKLAEYAEFLKFREDKFS